MQKQKDRASTENRKNTCKFIYNLYRILQEQQYKETITWSSNGKSFIIKDSEEFQKSVLPKFFKHNKISSFLRQLNMYSFLKKKSGKNWKQYMHKSFIKNGQEQLKEIERKKQDKYNQKKLIKQKKLELKHQNQQNSQAKNKKYIYQLIVFNRKLFEENRNLCDFLIKNSNILSLEIVTSKTYSSSFDVQIQQLSHNSQHIERLLQEIQKIQSKERIRIQRNFEQILMQNEMIYEIKEIENDIISEAYQYVE